MTGGSVAWEDVVQVWDAAAAQVDMWFKSSTRPSLSYVTRNTYLLHTSPVSSITDLWV